MKRVLGSKRGFTVADDKDKIIAALRQYSTTNRRSASITEFVSHHPRCVRNSADEIQRPYEYCDDRVRCVSAHQKR